MIHIPADCIDLCIAVANAPESVRALVARIVKGGEAAVIDMGRALRAAAHDSDADTAARLRALAGED